MRSVEKLLGPRGVAVLTLGCLLVAVGATVAVPEPGSALVALAVAVGVVAAEAYPLHLTHGRERHTMTFNEAPLVLGLALSPGWLLVLGYVAGILASQLWRRLALPKVMFNVGQFAAAASIAVFFAAWLAGPLGVVVGVTAFAVVNDVAVQLVLRTTARRQLTLPLRGRAAPWFLHVAAATSVALVVGPVVEQSGLLALAFLAPLLLLMLSKRESTRQQSERQLMQTVAAQAVALVPVDRGTRTELLERTARQVLAADRADVVLLGAAGTVPDATTRAVLARGADGHTEGRLAGIAVGPETAPYAVLLLGRDDDHEPFRASDLAGLRLLAEVSAEWLAEAHDAALELDVLSSLTGDPALV